jgi:pyrroline-5-carboxylate reductase
MSLKGSKVGFLGAGNMGEAMIKGLLKTGLVPAAAIGATDARTERLDQIVREYGIHAIASNAALVKESDVVILAVKPQVMGAVLKEIGAAVDGTKLLISIAAGLATRTLREHLGTPARLIRVMPNTPALVLEGVTAIARGEGLKAGDLETAQELFGAVGRVVILDEDALDAVTGLSGSGPAYVAIVIESLADGGVKMGLDRATAMTLAAQTVLGSARLILETGAHPGQIKDMVASPGGTTIAGISALEEGGVRRTFINAVERATQRSRELGRSAGPVGGRHE